MRDIVRHLIRLLEAGREPVICQVLETRGSTPQKAGALMVIDPSGTQAGTLGGGCVENEVRQKAIKQIGSAGAAIHSFLLDHDYAWADGLICGGRMLVVSQPVIGRDWLYYFEMIDRLIDEGIGFTEAVAIEPNQSEGLGIGSRFLFDEEAKVRAAWPAPPAPEFLSSRVASLGERARPSVHGGFALLPTWARVRLVIVGAGHVGQAVANLAAQADFDVWVIDDRHQYANSDRFPGAQRILVGPIEETLSTLEVTPKTYALIVTRGHGHDQEALYHLAPTTAGYVGLIGSRRKIRLIFENLLEAGISELDLGRVSAPVGLEIGSQTVPEIAISIVAELIARRNLGPAPRGQVARPELFAGAPTAGAGKPS
jgi:xanthine dehydrogenase accessory factor